ncbi:MAG TPA: TIGR03960 family B12-binding radical SAM protein [Thermoanaerobaculia bacterium]|nr:TIGR03960 family B12-binding radical SAM protein [Thermoanaerobaculia bacterium]
MRYASLRRRLDPLLPQVEKPGRYVGLERNVVRKDLARASVTLALAFPDTYEIGMSHTGLKILYELVNRRAEFACERVYAPWVDLEAKMRSDGIPLFSTESFAPVADFDVLGFSLQAELNYSNILNMLDLAGLPVWQRDRRESDPIVLGGGPCTANPEPIADFFDAFLVGDAEEALLVFLDAYRDGRARGLSRRELLILLAGIDGIYVPSLYDVAYREDGRIASITRNDPRAPERARRTWVPVLKPDYYPDRPMVPSVEIVQDRLGLEVMRGCTQGCRFCQAGYWYRPVRELDPNDVAAMTTKFIADSGWSEVGLLSLSTADYSQIEPLVKCLAPQLSDRRVSISLPSLRAEAFSVGLADAVSEVRKSGFTFAPETGSDRLRRVINKTFTNADMIAAADVAFARGWDLIKVYTMIGLPTETQADLDELVILVEGILAQGRKHGRKNVNVSVGSFVPKSWTPFQWAPFDDVATLERKLAYLKEKFRFLRGAKMKWHEPREAEIECVLSRGDRRAGRILHTAWKSGVRFDGWTEHFRHDLWTRAFETEGIPKQSYLRAYDLDEILPWDVLDVSIKKRWLQIELIKARKEMRTEDCKWGHCYACGVPGNGEDTMLAKGIQSVVTPLPPGEGVGVRGDLPAAYRDVEKGAAYRQKAMPDLPSASRRAAQGDRVFRHRVTFSKSGDARFLSHRNTMDALERAIRAAGLPARYSEGFNPHMKLSMGPALALGLESRQEVFDVEGTAPFPADAAARITEKLPPGVAVAEVRLLAAGESALSKAVKGARYAVRLDDAEHLRRATDALSDGWRESLPALRSLSLEADGDGARLRFEVNLDQAAGETATAKKVLESLLAIQPAEQLALEITREATVLG